MFNFTRFKFNTLHCVTLRGGLMVKKYWVISDTHFYHKKIIEYCKRPDNFNELLITSLGKIPEDHVLIHLGDVAWERSEEVPKMIKCKKILVMGNHDSESAMKYMSMGWDFACESFTLDYCTKKVLFSHKPHAWDGTWEVNVHGHLHNSLEHEKQQKFPEFQKLIACEYLNYKPIDLQRVLMRPAPFY